MEVNDKFGDWTVVSLESNKSGYVVCQCRCGEIKLVCKSNLRNNKTKSCGCMSREIVRKRMTTHGESNSRLYGVWLSMRNRCNKKTVGCYDNYGGRGIKVCEEWDLSYMAFRDWSMKNGFLDGLELDRKDVNGNYEPSNCRWITKLENARNRRDTIFIEISGETKPLQAWAEEKGFLPSTIRRRYNDGLRGEDLFAPLKNHQPPKSKPKIFIEINGVSKSLREWSEFTGINFKTLEHRYYQRKLRGEDLISPIKERQNGGNKK